MSEFAPHPPETEYREKKEKNPVESYEIMRNPEARKEVLQRIDNLIDDTIEQDTDVLFFLDKSARPLSWLFRERYKNRFPERTLPEIKFTNIGSGNFNREDAIPTALQAKNFAAALRSGDLIDEDALPPSWKEKMHDEERERRIKNVYGESLMNKNIIFVDEIGLSGGSLGTAIVQFRDAYPEAGSLQGMSLFHQEYIDRWPHGSNRDLMPWYSDPGLIGVFDRADKNSLLAGTLNAAELGRFDGLKVQKGEELKQGLHSLENHLRTTSEHLVGLTEQVRRIIGSQESLLKEYLEEDYIKPLEDILRLLQKTSISKKDFERIAFELNGCWDTVRRFCLSVAKQRQVSEEEKNLLEQWARAYEEIGKRCSEISKTIDELSHLERRREVLSEGSDKAKMLRKELKRLAKTPRT